MAKKGGNIVIIGGGASGMTAAIRAKQRGAEQVILLEAGSELGGNAVYAPVPLLNPEQLTECAIEKEYLEMMQLTDWTSDPRIVRTLLENSARMKKKMLCAMLAATFLLSMFAGCSSNSARSATPACPA